MANEETIELPSIEPANLAPEAAESAAPEEAESSEYPPSGEDHPSSGEDHCSPGHFAHSEQRQEARVRVRWRGNASWDGVRLPCTIRQVSSVGADILIDSNLQKVRSLRLEMHIPPTSPAAKPRIIVVQGKIVYTAYDSDEWMFRSGVSFTEYDQETDREYLHSIVHGS